MKKLILVLLMAAGMLIQKPVAAQVNVNFNIGAQPVWGPVGYDYVEYYYLPDIEAYYYVPTRQFIYLTNNRWVFRTALPYRYRGYDIYRGYKVVINEPRPYLRYKTHTVVYARYKGYNSRQVIIRNSNNPKYYVVKGHPKYYSRGNNTVSTKNKTNVSKGGNRSGNNSVGKTKGGGKGKNKS